jgi:anti-sigma-K factor RskA
MNAALGRHSPAMHGVLSENERRRLAKEAATARAAACATGRHPAVQQRLATPAAVVAWKPPSCTQRRGFASGLYGHVCTQRQRWRLRRRWRPVVHPAAAAAVRVFGLARMRHAASGRGAVGQAARPTSYA